jgi:hypothetical protein
VEGADQVTDGGWQPSLFATDESGYEVREISSKETHWWMLNIHYARRIPSITYAFGLIKDGELVGVVSYGTPASNTLCRGICGDDYEKTVVELNRLVLRDNLPNEASRLVGKSLKMLPTPLIVVSFADTKQDHLGIVYQATNFLYTGLSTKRNEWAVKGMEHIHSRTLSHGNTLDSIKEKYGDDFYYRERSRKHRYIILLGNKTEKRKMRSLLRYEVQPYPKDTPDSPAVD